MKLLVPVRQIFRSAESTLTCKNTITTSTYAENPPRQMPAKKPLLHRVNLAPQIQLVSADNKWQMKNKTNYELSGGNTERPLMLYYSWLMAKDKYIEKYIEFYTNLGFDVLKIKTEPKELLRPVKGTQVTATKILDILHQNEAFQTVIVKGMSVGCYAFGEALVKLDDNFGMYGKLLDRFVGQIYDSPVDVNKIPEGVSQTLTDHVRMRHYLKLYLEWFMKANYAAATRHYERSAKYIYDNYVSVPGLFINSQNDFLSTPKMMEPVYETWETVYTKNFKDTKHVAHYQKHINEYEKELVTFLRRIRLISAAEKEAVTS